MSHCVSSGGSRIFPRGGVNPPGGAWTRQIFPKTAWNRKNLDAQGGGGARPSRPPLDPPMVRSCVINLWNIQCPFSSKYEFQNGPLSRGIRRHTLVGIKSLYRPLTWLFGLLERIQEIYHIMFTYWDTYGFSFVPHNQCHHYLLVLMQGNWERITCIIVMYQCRDLILTSAALKLFRISDNDINASTYILNGIMFVIYWVLGLWWAAQVWIDPTNP